MCVVLTVLLFYSEFLIISVLNFFYLNGDIITGTGTQVARMTTLHLTIEPSTRGCFTALGCAGNFLVGHQLCKFYVGSSTHLRRYHKPRRGPIRSETYGRQEKQLISGIMKVNQK